MTGKNQQKVLAIGLDSAVPGLVFPWAKKGLLPNIKMLMENGAFGRLESTLTTISAVTWESSMTGKNPGKHGVFDFFRFSQKTHELKPLTSRDRKAKAVWDLLGENNKPVIIVNYPIGYPPPPVNGVFVAGMNTPSLTNQFTFPASVKGEILSNVPNYRIDINFGYLRDGTQKEFLDHLVETTEARRDAVFYLMEHYPWQFLMVVFTSLDRLQHYYLNNKEVLLTFYKKLDQIIGQFLSRVDDQTTVIVYSDHGMGDFRKEIYLNTFLNKKGYLKLKSRDAERRLRTTFWDRIRGLIKKFAYKTGFSDFVLRKIPSRILKVLIAIFQETGEFDAKKLVDWQRTEVFFISPGTQGIALILKEENRGKYEGVKEDVVRALKELEDPETKQKVIKNVFKKEECYWGPYLQDAPDLIVEPMRGYDLSGKFEKGFFGRPQINPTGIHVGGGMVILYGAGVKGGVELKGVKIFDIAPTILSLFGLKVPSDMDGKVLAKALTKSGTKGSKRKKPKSTSKTKKDSELSEKEEEKIKDRLRSLGYI